MKPAFTLGLRGRLFLLLGAVFTALAGVIVVQSLHDRSDMISAASEQLLSQAKLIAARQQSLTARGEALLSGLLSHPELHAAGAACSPLLADRLKHYTEFINIGMALPDGTLACSAVPAAGPINFSERYWFQQAQQTREMGIGDVVTGRVVGKPLISFAKARRDDAGRVTGVFFVSLEIAWLERELAKEQLPQGARLMVVDDQGLVALRKPDPEIWAGRSIAHLPLFKHFRAEHVGEDMVEETGLDGVRRLYAHAPLLATTSGRKYHLLLGIPQAVIVAPAQRELAVNLGLALLIIAGALALVVVGGNRLVLRPLLALSRTAARLGAGDLAVRSGLAHTDDDIGRLARTVDETAAALQATERARAELKTAGELFRTATNASLDALFILASVRDADGRIADFEIKEINVRAEQMLGLARTQIIGQKLCELLPWVRTQGRFDPYAVVVNTGVPLDEEVAVDVPGLAAKWLRQQAVRLNGGMALFMRDVTAWKEAGAALKASEERFRNLVETSNDWVWEVDENVAYTYASPQVRAILGYLPEEVLGKTPFDLMPAEEAQRVATLFGASAAAREAIVNLENVNLHKDGHRVVLETSSVPVIDPDGKLRGYRGIDRDITERKQHEMQIINLNRALRTLSSCNVTLIHAQTERELLQEVCLTIVETGGHQLAWVEYPVGAEVTWYGDEAMYRLHAELALKPEHDSLNLTAIALRTRQTQIGHKLQERPASHFGPLHAAGVQSILALPLLHNSDIHGVLTILSSTPDVFDADEVKLMEELAADLAYGIVTLRTRAERDRIAYAHEHHAQILKTSLEQSIQAIAGTVEARDPYTAGHQRRVSEMAVAIARELGLPEENIHGLRLAATIHDLGKIHIPAEYLSKPGKLTDMEFAIIKTHPQAGYDILKGIEFPWPIADMVRQHHERLDGSGYPQGLKGDQILFESRILAVADVVEAMGSHRPYRATLGVEVALREIERGRGSTYDAAVVDACLKMFREGRFAV